jgi:secreted trypsin-like serine protease
LRDLDDEGVDQIVGGTPAAAGEFPFQVIILIYLLPNNYCLSAKYYF